jgi:hypothetical protein
VRSRTGPIRAIIQHTQALGMYAVLLECGHKADLVPRQCVETGKMRCGECATVK